MNVNSSRGRALAHSQVFQNCCLVTIIQWGAFMIICGFGEQLPFFSSSAPCWGMRRSESGATTSFHCAAASACCSHTHAFFGVQTFPVYALIFLCSFPASPAAKTHNQAHASTLWDFLMSSSWSFGEKIHEKWLNLFIVMIVPKVLINPTVLLQIHNKQLY